MNAQEQMESLLKDMYTCLTNGEQIPGKPGRVAVDRSQFMGLLEQVQDTFYAVLRAQSAAGSEEARKKESRIVGRAQAHAEDVYAASLLYSDGMIGELKALFDKTSRSFEEVMRTFQKEFDAQQELLGKQGTELHAQLADLADTGKYLQLIEEENARRKAPAVPEQNGAKPEPAAGQEEILINEDAEYFKWKEEQEHLEAERRKEEKAKQERLEQERLEQERIEQERLEQERIERERLEQERIEQERLEQERLEQERIEREQRLEQERLEKERLKQERLEQERLEKERLEQKRLEQERLERERLEQERLEQERLEKKRLEQERLAQERRQKEDNLQKTQVIQPAKTAAGAPAKTADLSEPAAAAAAYRKATTFDDLGDEWLDDDSELPDEDVLLKAMLAGEMQTETVPGADPSFTTQGTRSPQSRTENLDVLELDYMDFDEPMDLGGLDDLEPIPESGRSRKRSKRKDDYDDDDYNDSGSSGKKSGRLKGFLLGN